MQILPPYSAFKYRDCLSSVFFAAPFLLFYNVYWEPSIEIKYGTFVSCLFVSYLIVAGRPTDLRVPIAFFGWMTISLVLCVLYFFTPERDTPTLILFVFSIFVAFAAFLIVPRVDARVLLAAVTIVFSIILLQIWMGFEFLADHGQRNDQIGTLGYDSYPVIGMLSGVTGLLYLHWRTRPYFLPVVGIAAVIYLFLNGQARGELLAFGAIATFMMFPRASILLLPVVAGAFYLALEMSDLPIFERLRLGVEVGFQDRVQLFEDSLLLLSEGWTALVGLGINGYQDRLGLEIGYYPHNSALETVLSGGVLYFLLYLLLFFVPLVKAMVRHLITPVYNTAVMWAIPAFMFLISLKSFSIFTNWPMMYFLPLVFLALKSTRHLHKAEEAGAYAPAGEQVLRSSLR